MDFFYFLNNDADDNDIDKNKEIVDIIADMEFTDMVKHHQDRRLTIWHPNNCWINHTSPSLIIENFIVSETDLDDIISIIEDEYDEIPVFYHISPTTQHDYDATGQIVANKKAKNDNYPSMLPSTILLRDTYYNDQVVAFNNDYNKLLNSEKDDILNATRKIMTNSVAINEITEQILKYLPACNYPANNIGDTLDDMPFIKKNVKSNNHINIIFNLILLHIIIRFDM